MDAILQTLPVQFTRWAETAAFIVDLERYFTTHIDSGRAGMFAELPGAPDHLDREAVDECCAIAAMLAVARSHKYEVTWDMGQYAADISNTSLPNNLDLEARLMAKYPPLIGIDKFLHRQEGNLPVVVGPAMITDNKGNTLLWSLPGVLSEARQWKILTCTCLLEAQLTTHRSKEDDPETRGWRTVEPFFSPGEQWRAGTALSYPAGFQLGHTGRQFTPSPSTDAKATRSLEWMSAFKESGGMLDGILAITHPDLYRTSQILMEKIIREHDASRSVMRVWPTCFTSVQVIVNRMSLHHRDLSGIAGWFDMLLSLGTYGETAVLELRGLGISLPYDSGSIIPISSRIVMHGVPQVPRDRMCYVFYMNREVFKWFDILTAGMANVSQGTVEVHEATAKARLPLINAKMARSLGYLSGDSPKGVGHQDESSNPLDDAEGACAGKGSHAEDVPGLSMPIHGGWHM